MDDGGVYEKRGDLYGVECQAMNGEGWIPIVKL